MSDLRQFFPFWSQTEDFFLHSDWIQRPGHFHNQKIWSFAWSFTRRYWDFWTKYGSMLLCGRIYPDNIPSMHWEIKACMFWSIVPFSAFEGKSTCMDTGIKWPCANTKTQSAPSFRAAGAAYRVVGCCFFWLLSLHPFVTLWIVILLVSVESISLTVIYFFFHFWNCQ